MNKNALAESGKNRQIYVLEDTQPKQNTKRRLEEFVSVAEMVRRLEPAEPVHVVRPHVIRTAATWFLNHFPGEVMYSVKSNPDLKILRTLHDAGIAHFDVASLPEVALVHKHFPQAEMYFMHPVKSRESIFQSYFEYGVRTYSLDTHEELAKIMECTGNARDLNLYVRLSMPNEHAAYSLAGKFGMNAEAAIDLLKAVRKVARTVGICFHVGSQCMSPGSYNAAIRKAKDVIVRSGVKVDAIDVGGGFPSIYPDLSPPPLSDYMDSIRETFAELNIGSDFKVFCEPGRALVAEAGSLVVRVDLRKGDSLYINDGIYGSLFDAGSPGFTYPTQAFRKKGELSAERAAFSLFGPTCDSMDSMKGPFMLPKDIGEGDWIEIGQLGAYGSTMRTKFNGFYSDRRVNVADEPMLSMFGF